MSAPDRRALTFSCAGERLVGVLDMPVSAPTVGVVIVVGGPQYRVGSHRQFLLLARALAAQGIAALRFDCRGMGDSDGTFPGFQHIEPDIASAVDALVAQLPSLRRIVLWGLCDACSAIAERARRDKRITGVVLLNPWVRSEQSLARTHLKHYYLARLVQRDFLRKVLTGRFNLFASARALRKNLVHAFGLAADRGAPANKASNELAEAMADDLRHFAGRVLVILSGKDLTAKEFDDATRGSDEWQKLYRDGPMTRRDLPGADHTFSRRAWRDKVADWTVRWITENEVVSPAIEAQAGRAAHFGKSSSV